MARSVEVELSTLPTGESQRHGVSTVDELDAVREVHEEVEPVDRRHGLDDDSRRHLVAFQGAGLVELDPGAEPRRRRQHEPGRNREQERCGERHELGLGEDQGGQQADGREPRVPGQLGRRVARQVFARSSATGVGTVASRSRTTSSAEMRSTRARVAASVDGRVPGRRPT